VNKVLNTEYDIPISEIVNETNYHGVTPLMAACSCKTGPSPQHPSVSRYVEVVRLLLQNDCIKVNKAVDTGSAAIHVACRNGYINIVRLLCQHPGIDISKKTQRVSRDQGGATPKQMAYQAGHLEIVSYLGGANWEQRRRWTYFDR